MCLVAKKSIGKLIAKESISCYKVLYKENDRYYSLIQHYDYTEVVENKGVISLSDRNEPIASDDDISLIVEEGFIHTFDTIDDASVFISTCCGKGENVKEGKEYHVFKCHIAKGTEYYSNVRKQGSGGFYASRELIFDFDSTANYLDPKLNNPDR